MLRLRGITGTSFPDLVAGGRPDLFDLLTLLDTLLDLSVFDPAVSVDGPVGGAPTKSAASLEVLLVAIHEKI